MYATPLQRSCIEPKLHVCLEEITFPSFLVKGRPWFQMGIGGSLQLTK